MKLHTYNSLVYIVSHFRIIDPKGPYIDNSNTHPSPTQNTVRTSLQIYLAPFSLGCIQIQNMDKTIAIDSKPSPVALYQNHAIECIEMFKNQVPHISKHSSTKPSGVVSRSQQLLIYKTLITKILETKTFRIERSRTMTNINYKAYGEARLHIMKHTAVSKFADIIIVNLFALEQ